MRLFFALVPDDGIRAALARVASDLARSAGGRVVPAPNLHLTMVFVGEADAAVLPALLGLLPAMPREAFTMTLDRVGGWRAAGVGWMAPTVVPPELATLNARLNGAVAACGLPAETRPFHPHVTLVRRPRRVPAAPVAPIAWHVRRRSLRRSESAAGGVRYREEGAVALDDARAAIAASSPAARGEGTAPR